MAREFALFVLEGAATGIPYKVPIQPTTGSIWTNSGAGISGPGVILQSSGGTGFNAFYARLDQGDSFTMRARPQMITVPYGGGFNIPAFTVSDKFVCKGRYVTKLYAGPFTQFLFQWASQVVNAGGYVNAAGTTWGWEYGPAAGTAGSQSGNLPSVTILHGIQRPLDGSYKCQQYSGVKVDSWTLTGSEDSQMMTLTLELTGGTASGNPYDGSVDPTVGGSPGTLPTWYTAAGTVATCNQWSPPAGNNLPVNPFLFVNCSNQAEAGVPGTLAAGTAVLGNGTTTGPVTSVASITETTLGSGYLLPPAVTFSGGGGYGASAIAVLNSTGGVASYVITSGGTGYTSAPTVTVTPVPASGLFMGVSRTMFQEFTLSSTNNAMSRFWANRFVQFIEFCGRTTKLTVRNFYQPTSTLATYPDDRYNMEALATQTASFGFNNGVHAVLFTMNTYNIIETVEDSLPLGDIYTQNLTLTSQFDPNYSQTDAYLPADLQLSFA